MKALKRALLINWLNYSFEEVEFGKLTFLTGKNASGKSTLIDALQLVLLGDTNGRFFNQAANEKSGRTLESYLYGYSGDDSENLSVRTMRLGGFTSYVALEFFDEEKNKSFVLAFVAYCKKDRKITHKWLIIHDGALPETRFIDAHNKPLNLDELKEFLEDNYKGKYDFYDSNARYREAELFEMGELKAKYHSTLRKAVPFAPILNIADFITEYICDVKSNIDISGMQKAIRGYSDLEDEARIIEEKIRGLNEILTAWNAYKESEERKRRYEYFLDRIKIEDARNRRARLEKERLAKEKDLSALIELSESLKIERDALSEKMAALYEKLYNNSERARKVELERVINEKSLRINTIESNLDKIITFFKNASSRIRDLISALESVSVRDLDHYLTLSEDLGSIVRGHLKDLDLKERSRSIDSFSSSYSDLRSSYNRKAEDLNQEIEELEKRIKDLEKGIKAYPKDVLAFKAKLEEELKREVEILSDVLEVDERYYDYSQAFEAILNEKRFRLIIKDDEREIAEKVLREFPFKNVGFISPSDLKEGENAQFRGALKSNNSTALSYVNNILSQLDKATLDKNGFVFFDSEAFSLDGSAAFTPFLGQNAIKIQLEKAREQRRDLKAALDSIIQIKRAFSTVSLQTLDDERIKEFSNYIDEEAKLDDLKKDLDKP